MNSTIPPDSVNAILCISFGPFFCRAPVLLATFIIPLGTQHLVCSSHTVVYTPDQGLSCRLTMLVMQADDAVLLHKVVLVTK